MVYDKASLFSAHLNKENICRYSCTCTSFIQVLKLDPAPADEESFEDFAELPRTGWIQFAVYFSIVSKCFFFKHLSI